MPGMTTLALPNHTCPLCGGPNTCAPAASGDLQTPCWCRVVKFTPELLAKVPEAQKGKACICEACARETR
ncbi:MAG: hypothetical protein RI907_2227 [Pseudomonadota bacterium]|jgi:hypothetical protein